MNPLVTNAQPFNPHASPMTLIPNLMAMYKLALEQGPKVSADVWGKVLDVYSSYNMSVSHLPRLPQDGRTPIVLKSKDEVLDEIRERLDMDAYRMSRYSARDFKQAGIDLVKDRLPDMVDRRVISSDPADALLLSAQRCLSEMSVVDTTPQPRKGKPAFIKGAIVGGVIMSILSVISGVAMVYSGEVPNAASLVKIAPSVGIIAIVGTLIFAVGWSIVESDPS